MGFTPSISDTSPFTLHNIPFGVISTGEDATPRCATAVGDHAIDLYGLCHRGFFADSSVTRALSQTSLNAFAELPASVRTATRECIITACKDESIPPACVHELSTVQMHLPMHIHEFTDFLCSLEHCQNCVNMIGGEMPLNFYDIPLAYNGRASSVVPSPSVFRRPRGVFYSQQPTDGARRAEYGVSKMIDFELEMAYLVSKTVPHGQTIDINNAADYIFGFVLLNDWSSRDIQAHEMRPTGAFNSKSFGTTISSWVTTLDALSPFRCKPRSRPDPFEYLRYADLEKGTFDIKLAVHLEREGGKYQLGLSNLSYLYWTPFQQITQHASAGCGFRSGDLIATGTVSGGGKNMAGNRVELGSLLEATEMGTRTVKLEDGVELGYLADKDYVTLSAWCEDGSGRRVFGLGECRGQIVGPDD
ncbi:uncharacterized protein A1O9_00524 [Exophiala aquamarina CBS 119918]|uniref:Fumarylacetoacetase n=1 Tax=Exophiala aquamarina CBS 119918 TaxID=1182545 RepID=A0A072PRP8_9EURO|nr:uncharacterized protein A1O9_00524 [Exophiala aquamarina CBS 119918]KEF62551.1 hypothetical protein A1O9_00524 [Exophiala aquamarina CBS 119918]